jgi:putative solute:sodium symporter small subunit
MFNALLHADMAEALAQTQKRLDWARSKRLILVLFGLWIGYFALVNAYVHKLSKITLPVIEIPLDVYLTVQGAAIVFAVALFRFARRAE